MPDDGRGFGDADPGDSSGYGWQGFVTEQYNLARNRGFAGSLEQFRNAWIDAYHANEGRYDNLSDPSLIAATYNALNISRDSDSGGDDDDDGGGGGGGGGGSTYDGAAARASFIGLLRSWELATARGRVLGGLEKLVDQAVNKKYTTDEFVQLIRKTKTYAQRFAGIPGRVDEISYLNEYNAYADIYKNLGRGKLTRQEFAQLAYKKGVGLEDWAVRVDAMERIKENGATFRAFNQYMMINHRNKLPKNKQGQRRPLNKKEIYNLITKQGDAAFEQIWDKAYAVAQLQNVAGIGQVGKGQAKMIGKLVQQWESRHGAELSEALGDDFFQNVASNVATLMPLSQLKGWGITENEILQVAFEGRKSGELTHKFMQLLANAKAEDEGKMASPQLAAGPGGGTQLLGYNEVREGE